MQDLCELPEVGSKFIINVGSPEMAFNFGQLPKEGIGFARLKFVINNAIWLHHKDPQGAANCDTLDGESKALVDKHMRGYSSPKPNKF